MMPEEQAEPNWRAAYFAALEQVKNARMTLLDAVTADRDLAEARLSSAQSTIASLRQDLQSAEKTMHDAILALSDDLPDWMGALSMLADALKKERR